MIKFAPGEREAIDAEIARLKALCRDAGVRVSGGWPHARYARAVARAARNGVRGRPWASNATVAEALLAFARVKGDILLYARLPFAAEAPDAEDHGLAEARPFHREFVAAVAARLAQGEGAADGK